MTTLSRREFFEYLVKGSSLFVIGVTSCSNKNNYLLNSTENILNDDENDVIKIMVENYCRNNINGDHLKSDSTLSLSKESNVKNIYAKDKFVVADEYELIKQEKKDGYLFYKVRYKYHGVVKGDKYYRYNPKNKKDNYLIFNFRILEKNGEYIIDPRIPSFVSLNSAKIHIQYLINDTKNGKTLKEIDFSNRIENLNKILTQLS